MHCRICGSSGCYRLHQRLEHLHPHCRGGGPALLFVSWHPPCNKLNLLEPTQQNFALLVLEFRFIPAHFPLIQTPHHSTNPLSSSSCSCWLVRGPTLSSFLHSAPTSLVHGSLAWCTCHSLIYISTAELVTATLTAAWNGHFMLCAQYTNMEQSPAPPKRAS